MHDASYLLPAVIDIAKKAGQTILNIYQTDYQTKIKADNTPVTDADLKAHALIKNALNHLEPKLPVLSEEGNAFDFATRKTWTRYWLVDPLDGTREFIDQTGEFSVNIALIDKNHPVLGVVYAPNLQLLYYASFGSGAYRIKQNADVQLIQIKPINLKSVIAIGSSRAQKSDGLRAFLSRFESVEFMCVGSSIKTCLVADGTADVYPRFGPTSEWDTAAAQCILEEAGGQMFDFDFQQLRYNQKDSLLNTHFLAVGDSQFDWQTVL